MSVRKRDRIELGPDEILFLLGSSGELGLAKTGRNMELFIGTPEKEEIVVFLEKDDLIAVSAFETGHTTEKAIKSMVYLLKEFSSPIIVLPENHPTSKRLKMVVACGDHIKLNCDVHAGTHPEQDILCSCEDLSGMDINAAKNGVEIEGNFEHFKIEKLDQ